MKLIIHCSDSDFGNAALLTIWHVLPKPKGRGWSNIGYHTVILNGRLSSLAYDPRFDGHVETGRPLDADDKIEWFEVGAHTLGFNHNPAICMIGKSGKFTPKQLKSLEKEVELKCKQFPIEEIEQHSKFDPINKPHCAGLSKEYIASLNEKFVKK